jgi:hypothetical protein
MDERHVMMSPVAVIFSHDRQAESWMIEYIKVIGYAPCNMDITAAGEYIREKMGLKQAEWPMAMASRPGIVADAIKAGIL